MTHIPKTPIEPPNDLSVTEIIPADLPAVVRMLDDLAEYEEVTEPVRSTVQSLHAVMFGPIPILFGFIARRDGEPAGVVLGYETYSDLRGKQEAVHRGLVRQCQLPRRRYRTGADSGLRVPLSCPWLWRGALAGVGAQRARYSFLHKYWRAGLQRASQLLADRPSAAGAGQ